MDSFDFGDFDSLDTGVNVQNQPVATPDVSNIVTSLKKRAMVVFFVVDISGSMRGARIGAVNDAIRNVLPELKKRERGNTAAEIRIAVLEFSTRANWRTLSPEPVSTFQYQDIENVGGGTNYGTAFAALNEKLSRKQFLNEKAFNYYLKGAKSNHVYAQFSVALAFATGQGVKRDMQEAKRWLKSAASLGHGEAQHKLKELGEKWD